VKDNIKIEPKEIGYEIMDWTHLAQNNGKQRAFVKSGCADYNNLLGRLKDCQLLNRHFVTWSCAPCLIN
jgi:hypothetical protein